VDVLTHWTFHPNGRFDADSPVCAMRLQTSATCQLTTIGTLACCLETTICTSGSAPVAGLVLPCIIAGLPCGVKWQQHFIMGEDLSELWVDSQLRERTRFQSLATVPICVLWRVRFSTLLLNLAEGLKKYDILGQN
jgi:hypothetical protein